MTRLLNLLAILGGINIFLYPVIKCMNCSCKIEIILPILLMITITFIYSIYLKWGLSSITTKGCFTILNLNKEELKLIDLIYKGLNPYFWIDKKIGSTEYMISHNLINKGYLESISYNGVEAVKLTKQSNKLFKKEFFTVSIFNGKIIDYYKYNTLTEADTFIQKRAKELQHNNQEVIIIVVEEPSMCIVKMLSVDKFSILPQI